MRGEGRGKSWHVPGKDLDVSPHPRQTGGDELAQVKGRDNQAMIQV